MIETLPGIRSVKYAICESVEISSDEKLRNNLEIYVTGDFIDIELSALASISSEGTNETKQGIFTTTLKFVASEQPDIEFDLLRRPVCFLLEDVCGEKYLLGTNKKPYPLIKNTDSIPENASDVRVKNYEVSYVNVHKYLKLKAS